MGGHGRRVCRPTYVLPSGHAAEWSDSLTIDIQKLSSTSFQKDTDGAPTCRASPPAGLSVYGDERALGTTTIHMILLYVVLQSRICGHHGSTVLIVSAPALTLYHNKRAHGTIILNFIVQSRIRVRHAWIKVRLS